MSKSLAFYKGIPRFFTRW